MPSFYRVLTAIFVTIFSWIGPVSADSKRPLIPSGPCEASMVPAFQTALVKKAINNPVDLYRELYERNLRFVSEEVPNNFPVTDLFSEDLSILKNRLEKARDYLQEHNRSVYADLMEQLIVRADSMLKNGFGYVSYWAFSNIDRKSVV